MVQKEQMMRRMDFSGEKVCSGAWAAMAVWMEERLLPVKIVGSWRLVIRRVLLGGEGWIIGGRSDRSRDISGECRRRE